MVIRILNCFNFSIIVDIIFSFCRINTQKMVASVLQLWRKKGAKSENQQKNRKAMGLFGKIFEHVFKEVATKHLAKSQTFQNLAMKTHRNVEQSKKILSKSSDELHGKMGRATSNLSEFRNALREEFKKDFDKFNKK